MDKYTEVERGWCNASLVFNKREIARTDQNIVIAYMSEKRHSNAIEEWAEEYGYPIEWI